MEESRKRLGYDSAGESAVKRPRAPAISDDNDEDILAWLSVDEETVGELMKLLENEINSPVKVKFIDDPYSLPLIFQSSSSSSYVTINGNEESCGSSFSDSESSLMASIDMGGINKGGGTEVFSGWNVDVPAAEDGGAWVDDEEVAGYWAEDGEGSGDGSNGSDDWDDEVLARFLGEDLF